MRAIMRAFEVNPRILLCLVVLAWVAQGCVVTAEKKIPVYTDTVEEDQGTTPEDTVGDEISGEVAPADTAQDTAQDTVEPSQEDWDIGPDGGSFLFHGGVRLVVPPGALAGEINVLIGKQAGAVPPDGVIALTDIWVIPDLEGIVFNLPILLILPLLEELPELTDEVTWDQLGGFTSGIGGEWEKLPASVDLIKRELSIPTIHFSLFVGGLGGGGTSCVPEDEVCNGLDDDCDGAIDEAACAAGEACYMGSMCTSGTCAWIYGGTEAVCAETEGGCVIIVDEVVTQVEDGGVLCTGATTYRQCQAGVFTESAPCSEGFEGTYLCDEEIGECGAECAVDGDCADADLCDGGKACVEGLCVDAGAPVDCPEDTDCSTFTCVPATGECQGNANNDGGACDDGDPCTESDVCVGIACSPGGKKECGDGNPCTADSCDSETGACVNDTATMDGQGCDDDDPCTEGDVCDAAGACAGIVKDCDDSNGCTVDSCDPMTGDCQNVPQVGEACDDGDACTDPDACTAEGLCAGIPAVDCDDFNDCTADACDPSTGLCDHTPVGAGTSCSYPDASPEAQNPCFPDAACNGLGICLQGASSCECLVDVDCPDDGDLCNGVPACDTGSFPYLCVDDPSSVVECDPGGTCFELVCDPGTGDCAPQGINEGGACDDENVCTTGETCASAECAGGVVADCDDGDPCTVDACDPVDGCGHEPAPALPCDDGDECTLNTCTADGSACLYEDIPGCCVTDDDCGGQPCIDGFCCVPICDDGQGGFYECGDDGCGGTCGTCTGNDTCDAETHLCVCETCCLDSSECSALEICMAPGGGDQECTALTPLFQASFDDETAGEVSSMFTYSWPAYSPGWVVYEASSVPQFANSQSRSLRYNKYKSNGWLEFSATLPGGGTGAWLSLMVRCPVPPVQNWSMEITGDGGVLTTISSQDVCGTDVWHHIAAPVTALGDGLHTFRFNLSNLAFGTIYLDDVVILTE